MSRQGIRELEEALNDPANQSGTGAWARAQSDEGLQGVIDWDEPGSTSYEAAVREQARRESAQSGHVQLKWIKRTFWATIILGVAVILATLTA